MRKARSLTNSFVHQIREFAHKAKGSKGSTPHTGYRPAPSTASSKPSSSPATPPPPTTPSAAETKVAAPPPPPPPFSSSTPSNPPPATSLDPRLLAGGGILASGLLYYAFFSGKDPKPSDNTSSEQILETSDQLESPPTFIDTERPATSTAAPDTDILQVGEDASSKVAAEKSSETAAREQQAVIQDGKNNEQVVEEAPHYVNSEDVLSVIQDVLTKDGTELLQHDEKLLAAAAAKDDKNEQQNKHKSSNNNATKKHDLTELNGVHTAVTLGIADTAAETAASIATAPSTVLPAKKHQPVTTKEANNNNKQTGDARIEQLPREAATAAGNIAGISNEVQELLGIHADTTASGLIAAALKRQGGMKEDGWEGYKEHHRQAVQDAETLANLLSTAANNVKSRLSDAEAQVESSKQEVAKARAALQAQAEQYNAALKNALQLAEERHKAALKSHAQQLTLAHAEVTVRERAERQQDLDALRLQLDAVEVALSKRSAESRANHAVQQVSLAVFALQDALQSGGELKPAVEFLKSVGSSDALIRTVLETVPSEKALPTRVQLQESFEDVERVVRELSALPDGYGGLFSVAVAKLAAKLKIREKEPQAANIVGGGIDKDLAAARAALTAGQLLQAAKELESATQGTAAAPAVSDWVKAAKGRAIAEQAAAVLEARAATMAASLA